ncbi:HNH endonuclease [Pseudomonas chlororaphis]|uniref:HNH endonuclease n=1 Tax=Pseudomonas chlororaphis TaxID=587753 RepID=UPI00055B8DE5|nr:HNH endonuclease signature motif containing protein [Pseudomonas chlororaphis]
MKKLIAPAIDPAEVFDTCIDSVDDPGLVEKLNAARRLIIDLFLGYTEKAQNGELYTLPFCTRARPEQLIVADLSKKELVSLYSNQLLQKGKAARKYYDRLIVSAPLGKCPLCGFGQATTLDHFLSKSRYPTFSVLPNNLIPACTDCNKSKGASVVTEGSQQPHLYFEDSKFETDPWVFAELIETTPPSIRYYVSPPVNWPPSLKLRAENHFKDLDLARRFGIEAAAELSGMVEILDDIGALEDRKSHLERFATVERRNRTNTWKAPMYEALAESAWFQQGGYKDFIQSPLIA